MQTSRNDGKANGRPPLLSVRDLRTYFYQDEGLVKAVDGVSFDVSAGKTVGVVGESGCGKSVTARSILRIVEQPGRIVGGQILFRPGAASASAGPTTEVDLAHFNAAGKEMRAIRGAQISLIFQEPMTSFSPVHTIGNQIVEQITIHQRIGQREAREKAIDLLLQVGVSRPTQRVDEYPYQLSGGLRQRAMIAMALSCDPLLLIADEPTTALDVTTQAQILDLLRQLQERRNMAIMLITHNLGVVAELASDVVVMYLGRVVERGPVDDIFHAPKHPYTRALLSSMPSLTAEARVKLPTISGSIPHPYNRPHGCPFYPRCPDFMPGTCDKSEPDLLSVSDRQAVSCFLYGGSDTRRTDVAGGGR